MYTVKQGTQGLNNAILGQQLSTVQFSVPSLNSPLFIELVINRIYNFLLKQLRQKKVFVETNILGEEENRKKNNSKWAYSLQTKPTNTLPYVHFSSYHPPGQKKEFTQGNDPQLLRINSSEKTFEKYINNPIDIQSEGKITISCKLYLNERLKKWSKRLDTFFTLTDG